MSEPIVCNSTPFSSYNNIYSSLWSSAADDNWIVGDGPKFTEEEREDYEEKIDSDYYYDNSQVTEQDNRISSKFTRPALREKNKKGKGGYKHVPHKDKPAQVVAKRNARERRRVQAVNSAFAKLRKAIPIENSRGKRVSKVKTLLYAIDYINNLQQVLQQDVYISTHHFAGLETSYYESSEFYYQRQNV